MNRWIFLLALPYVVTVSSRAGTDFECFTVTNDATSCVRDIVYVDLSNGKFNIDHAQYRIGDEESIKEKISYFSDMAEALNAAHQRREQPADCEAQYIQCGNEYLQAIVDKENGIDKEIAR